MLPFQRQPIVAALTLMLLSGAIPAVAEEDAVSRGEFGLADLHHLGRVNLDLYTKIAPALTHGIPQVAKLHIFVRARVAGNDVLATPPHKFVNRQIFEMTAVRQIDVFASIGRQPEQFIDDRDETEKRPLAWRRVIVSGIAKPPTEPNIAEHH